MLTATQRQAEDAQEAGALDAEEEETKSLQEPALPAAATRLQKGFAATALAMGFFELQQVQPTWSALRRAAPPPGGLTRRQLHWAGQICPGVVVLKEVSKEVSEEAKTHSAVQHELHTRVAAQHSQQCNQSPDAADEAEEAAETAVEFALPRHRRSPCLVAQTTKQKQKQTPGAAAAGLGGVTSSPVKAGLVQGTRRTMATFGEVGLAAIAQTDAQTAQRTHFATRRVKQWVTAFERGLRDAHREAESHRRVAEGAATTFQETVTTTTTTVAVVSPELPEGTERGVDDADDAAELEVLAAAAGRLRSNDEAGTGRSADTRGAAPCGSREPLDVDALLAHLQRPGGLGARGKGQRVLVRSLPAREARHSPLTVASLLGARVAAALATTGVTRLYSHQVYRPLSINPPRYMSPCQVDWKRRSTVPTTSPTSSLVWPCAKRCY